MSEGVKLLPCPFCGGEPRLISGDLGSVCWSVQCGGCDSEIGAENTKGGAAEWWNRRHPASALGPATRAMADAVAHVRKGKRPDRQIIVECGGTRHILAGETADAFLAELEADA